MNDLSQYVKIITLQGKISLTMTGDAMVWGPVEITGQMKIDDWVFPIKPSTRVYKPNTLVPITFYASGISEESFRNYNLIDVIIESEGDIIELDERCNLMKYNPRRGNFCFTNIIYETKESSKKAIEEYLSHFPPCDPDCMKEN